MSIASSKPSVLHPRNWYTLDRASISNGTHVVSGQKLVEGGFEYEAARLHKPGLFDGLTLGRYSSPAEARAECERDYYTLKWRP